jgi:hypothetical protein
MKNLKEPEAVASSDSIVTTASSHVTQPRDPIPALWHPISQVQCYDYYHDVYCRSGVRSFDGIHVHFSPRQFRHAFFQSPGKTVFSEARGERVLWIGALLSDADALHVQGYDRKRFIYTPWRRVSVWPDCRYVVIIIIPKPSDPQCAHFLTGFYVEGPKWKPTLEKIVASPRWA